VKLPTKKCNGLGFEDEDVEFHFFVLVDKMREQLLYHDYYYYTTATTTTTTTIYVFILCYSNNNAYKIYTLQK